MHINHHYECKPEICQSRFLELSNKRTFNASTDLSFLLKQSSECRECAKDSKDALKQKVADEVNTLFCETYIAILLPQNKEVESLILEQNV